MPTGIDFCLREVWYMHTEGDPLGDFIVVDVVCFSSHSLVVGASLSKSASGSVSTTVPHFHWWNGSN